MSNSIGAVVFRMVRKLLSRSAPLLENTGNLFDDVARHTGFGNAGRMRPTFQRHLKVSPHDYRNRFESI